MTSTDLDFSARRQIALDLLRERGIKRSQGEPWLFRLLWALRIKLRPPHFGSAFTLIGLHGLYFATVWGMSMWFFIWRAENRPWPSALVTSLGAGFAFGLAIAMTYRQSRAKLNLPAWEDLGRAG
ncbi:MAG TPA: DUF6404 family protein [Roseateles sp.]